jgi:alpha-L-fucosidase 2
VKKSLEIRGDKATGWATAWRINLWARLHDGDHAYAF